MNKVNKMIGILTTVMAILLIAFCAGPGKPQPKVEPEAEPSVEDLRKPVDKDPAMVKVMRVIKNVGRLKQEYMPYDKYQKLAKKQTSSVLDPSWFYDNYELPMNEKGYWVTVTYSTADRAILRDPRIETLLTDLPQNSITMALKTPGGRSYVLSDTEADGVLDFVKKAEDEAVKKVDVKLLDQMQVKYTWLIGIVKKYYKEGMK